MILEKADQPAQKLLMSAKGRGNLTNMKIQAGKDYVSDDLRFVEKAFETYGVNNFLTFLRENEISFREEENGRILLQSGKAI